LLLATRPARLDFLLRFGLIREEFGFSRWSLVPLRLGVDFGDFFVQIVSLLQAELMARVYVGNLDPRVTAREIEDEFRTFGVLRR
jgi:RNA recognition motif-containing protein